MRTVDNTSIVKTCELPSDGASQDAERIRARYAKTGRLIFLSHLELITLFTRAVKRAGVPVRFSQGFHPHPKFSFATALSVGVESFAEYLDIEVDAGFSANQLMEQLNGVLPEGIRIVPYYDRSDIVKASVGTVSKALIEGSILVFIVLYLLLNSIRGSIVVLIALPLSLLATFIVMKLSGITANLMSLGGLAISIGMIIDTTIIQVENVQRHLSEEGHLHPKLTTVLKAVMEVRKPSIFGELIIAITFIPILALEGIEGKMFGPGISPRSMPTRMWCSNQASASAPCWSSAPAARRSCSRSW